MIQKNITKIFAVIFIVVFGFAGFAKESKFSASLQDFIGRSKQDPLWEFLGNDPSWMFAKSALVFALLEESGFSLNASRCNNPICFQDALLHWNFEDAKILGSATQTLIGVSLITKIEKLPNGSFFVFYNPSGIVLLFKKILDDRDSYLRNPNMQKIYDAEVKQWFRNKISIIREIMQNKERFRKIAVEYRNAAFNRADFNGAETSRKIAEELVCSKYEFKLSIDPDKKECDERWIGMLIRRQIDGTLPTILSIINRFLFVFDSEEHARGVLKL
ncbi:hypothetical protein [Leptospira sanjuanensis]|uniref:hypothetical protein n=1 Tax=Leptospira sanjuanensis TaxID=2879643 RepID=UPI001EE94D05|nr:hypothetical protein [Leptospira sanjuanensis]MCG6168685.1 hypothetical protein [Leptospira sanjuanensis]